MNMKVKLEEVMSKMGSYNFGTNYNTRHSYQLMGEDISSLIIDEIKENLEEEIEAGGDLYLKDILGLPLDMKIIFDKIEVEHGYHEGVRYLPKFYIEFDYDNENEDTVYDYINEDYLNDQTFINDLNSYDGYESVIGEFLSDEAITTQTPEPLSSAHVEQIEEYFNKVDKVLNRYLVPYTVGWCASEVKND